SIEEEKFAFQLDQLTFGAFFTLPERADDRLAVGLIMLIVLYGAITNVLLLVAVLGTKEMRANPSYYLLIQIAVCDLVMLFFETFYHMAGIVFRQAYLKSA
ncbi:hypothetical protein PMAYCL1PPCAC_20277, partial [Pristionchus mayeri]